MEIVYNALVLLHLLGMAVILAGVVTRFAAPTAPAGAITFTGAAAQVLTGVALVGIASADLVDTGVDNTKIAVKLVIAVLVLVLALIMFRRPDTGRGLPWAVAGLTLINIGVAVFW